MPGSASAPTLRSSQARPSFDPEDPDVLLLETTLQELGPAPRRLMLPPGDEYALRSEVEAAVARGEVSEHVPVLGLIADHIGLELLSMLTRPSNKYPCQSLLS